MTARQLIQKLLEYDNLDEEIKFFAQDRNEHGLVINRVEYKYLYINSGVREGFHPDIVLDVPIDN